MYNNYEMHRENRNIIRAGQYTGEFWNEHTRHMRYMTSGHGNIFRPQEIILIPEAKIIR
jgi:hypothetical protein